MRIIPACIASSSLIFTAGLLAFIGYLTLPGSLVLMLIACAVLLEAALAWARTDE